MKILRWAGDALIARASSSPYFHLPGYMNRYWLLGARSSLRNDDKPGFVPGRASWLYEWVTARFAIRVHHILRSDREGALHDHPFSYLTVVLRGGYWEITEAAGPGQGEFEVPEDALGWMRRKSGARWRVVGGRIATYRGAGSVLWRPTSFRHKLLLPFGGTAHTLFFMGPRRQAWGFFTVDGKVSGKTFCGSKGNRTDAVETAGVSTVPNDSLPGCRP